MTKSKTLKRLDKLINEVKEIPEKITNLSADKLEIEKQKLNELLMRLRAFITVSIKDDKYLDAFNNLKFLPHEYSDTVFNSRHFKNDEAWADGRLSLITLLQNVSFELKEKLLMEGNLFTQREIIRFLLCFAISIIGLLTIFTTDLLDPYFNENRIALGKIISSTVLICLSAIIVLPKQWGVLFGLAMTAFAIIVTIIK